MNTTLEIRHAEPTTISVGSQPMQVCPALGDTTVLFYNNDLTNVVYVGNRTSGLTISNTVPVQPLASIVRSAKRVSYAFCPTGTVNLTVDPGGSNISPSPAQIQQQINTLGLATSANQSSQINQLSSQINQLSNLINQHGLYSQTANPFFTDPTTGNANAAGMAAVGASSVIPAGVNAAVGLPIGSGYPNGVQVTPAGGATICRVAQQAGFHINPGEIPTGHVLLYAQIGAAGTTAYLAFNFYDANNVLLSTSPVLTPIFTGAALWQKFTYPVNLNAAAPANADHAVFYVGLQNPGNVPNTQLFNVASYCAYNSNNANTIPGDTSQVQQLLSGALSGSLIKNTGLTVGQEVAALIASGSSTGVAGGTPLLHGIPANELFGYATPLAANSNITLAPITFTRPGYLINFRPQYSTTNGINAVFGIRLKWQNAGHNIDLAEQEWIVLIRGNSVYCPTIGQGPVQGSVLVIQLFNFDTAQSVTPFMDVYETTHHIARHDWRDSEPFGYQGVPNTATWGNPPFAAPAMNIVAGNSVSIAPNTTFLYIFPPYAGLAQIQWAIQSGASASPVQIFIDYMTPNSNIQIFNEALSTSNLNQVHQFVFPRSPTIWSFQNTSGTITVTISFSMSYLEHAS